MTDVKIWVPTGTDILPIIREFSGENVILDDTDNDGCDIYFVEHLTRKQAEDCCGFVEGAIAAAETLIDGCGGWAMSEVRKRKPYRDGFARGELSR